MSDNALREEVRIKQNTAGSLLLGLSGLFFLSMWRSVERKSRRTSAASLRAPSQRQISIIHLLLFTSRRDVGHCQDEAEIVP